MHLTYDDPAPLRYLYMRLADRFGWTIDYIESLTPSWYFDLFAMMDGESKALEKRKT